MLLIITDDAGFAVPSTFGGVIPTPSMDRLANEGLRYDRVFSTALCSPTCAALITGRNHHSVGFGVISEQATGSPGYNSVISKDKATIRRILLDKGYSTSWFGKDHNPAIAYPAGQALASQLRQETASNGIIYPSIRHTGGTCLAAFRPDLVQNLRQGGIWRLEWQGAPTPTVTWQGQ